MRLMRAWPVIPALALGVVVSLLSPQTAWAGRGEGGQQGGSQQGRSIDAFAHISIDAPSSTGAAGSGLSPVRSSWTPPPCFYAPALTPSEFKAEYEAFLNLPHFSGKGESARLHEERYGEGSEYQDHNIDREGEGLWWRAFDNPDVASDGLSQCDRPPFWVGFSDPPPAQPQAVADPAVLAELAYERIQVPELALVFSPDGTQTVNLATWLWSDGDTAFGPVSVRAQLNDWPVWAETTARPVSVTVDPGTEEAVAHPHSGTCAIGTAGSVGEPYAEGRAGQTPPCGVTYLRATHGRGPYELTASVTWEVSWTGSGGTGAALPTSMFETSHPLEVQEVQAIVSSP